jgi:hypothetical protein
MLVRVVKRRINKTEGRSHHLRRTGICEFVSSLLAANEELPPEKRLSDERIRVILIVEYGHLPSIQALNVQRGDYKARRTVGYFRTLYNLGVLLTEHRGFPPAKLSRRYSWRGKLASIGSGRELDAKGLERLAKWETEFRARRLRNLAARGVV